MLDRYRPSGKFSPTFLIVALAGIPVAVVSGVVYELAMQYIPLIYLDVLATIGAIAWLIYVGRAMVRIGKCRSQMMGALLGAGMGATAWITSFVFAWWWTVRNIPDAVGFFEYLPRRAELGFTIGKSGSGIPITGVFAYILWGIEGLAFVLGTMAPLAVAARKPFCEPCNAWANDHKLSFEVSRPGEATISGLGGAKELTDLVPDPSKKEDPGPEGTRLLYSVLGCPRCSGVDHLNVDFYYVVIENKAPKEKNKRLHESVLIGPDELEAIRAYAGEPGTGAKA